MENSFLGTINLVLIQDLLSGEQIFRNFSVSTIKDISVKVVTQAKVYIYWT